MNRVFGWALDRAQERTTWLGVALLLSSLGVAVSPALQAAIVEIGLAVSGLVLVLTKEHAGPARPEDGRGREG